MNAPTSSYDVNCSVLIENTPDVETWAITIDFFRPHVMQLKFELPARAAMKGWLPWRKSAPLHFIPSEMMTAPLISSAFLIKKALDLGLTLPDLAQIQEKMSSRSLSY